MSNDSDNNPAPSVQAQVQPSTARLGDLITLDLRVTHPPALAIEAPAFAKELGSFEVYASTQLPSDRENAQWVEHYQVQLQNFTTGPQLLPGIDVAYHDPMGRVGRLKTPELKVTIEEMPPGPRDKGDIRGIKGVIGPVAWSPWWWALWLGILCGAAVFAWAKRRRILEGPPPPPPVPPDEVALKKLQELLASGWLDTGRMKEFYSALSDIVRGYIENGFHCPALERTTSELLRDLRKIERFNPQILPELRQLLEDCDLVKFAKFKPEASEGMKDHKTALTIVENTKSLLPSREKVAEGRMRGPSPALREPSSEKREGGAV